MVHAVTSSSSHRFRVTVLCTWTTHSDVKETWYLLHISLAGEYKAPVLAAGETLVRRIRVESLA